MAAKLATMKTTYNTTALNAIINALSVLTLKIHALHVEETELIHLSVLVSQDSTMIL